MMMMMIMMLQLNGWLSASATSIWFSAEEGADVLCQSPGASRSSIPCHHGRVSVVIQDLFYITQYIT